MLSVTLSDANSLLLSSLTLTIDSPFKLMRTYVVVNLEISELKLAFISSSCNFFGETKIRKSI